MGKLDLTALTNAVKAFDRALRFAETVEAKSQLVLLDYEYESVRASVIQHFETTYELCWKTMKRFFDLDAGANILTRKELFRVSAEHGIINSFEDWVSYHTVRNKSTHIYDEEVAEEVYACAKNFYASVHEFVAEMEKRVCLL